MNFTGEEVHLEEILLAKENRVANYECLTKKYQGTIICYKLNIPGSVKSNDFIQKIFDAGLDAWNDEVRKNGLDLVSEKVMYQKTGSEYFAVFKNDPLYLKELTTNIEEKHSLGRLFDFDVIDKNLAQYSRNQIGRDPRKCLVCDNNAFQCGRARTHDLDTLLNKINDMAEIYFFKKGL